MNFDNRGQAGVGGLIALGIGVVVGFIVITELISGTALQTNALTNIALTVFFPIGLMIGIGRQFGFI